MQIVILDALTLGKDIDLSCFDKFGEVISYDYTKKDETIARLKDADIVITNKVVIDKAVMDSTNLKLVCVSATGTNNIDLEYAKTKNIIVKNVAGYSTDSVTQHTFAMLFSLLEQISYYDEYCKNASWSKSPIFVNIDRAYWQIKDKNWGIIGLGAIGRSVANVAKAFGSKICYYSTSGENITNDYKQVSLDELLTTCEIITIHAPLNSKTLNLIGKNELAKMKKDAILINVGRGGIVDENAVFEAVENERIYAGLDVLEVEPMSKDSVFLKLTKTNRMLLTPHIAWTSKEAREFLVTKVCENIENFLKG